MASQVNYNDQIRKVSAYVKKASNQLQLTKKKFLEPKYWPTQNFFYRTFFSIELYIANAVIPLTF